MCNLLRSSAPALQAGVRHGARCSQGSTFGPVVSQQARCCVTDHAVPVIQDVPGNGGGNPEDVILIEFIHQSCFKDLVSQDPYTRFLAGMISICWIFFRRFKFTMFFSILFLCAIDRTLLEIYIIVVDVFIEFSDYSVCG